MPDYKEESRKQILQTATRLILEKGYKNVNMGDIAAEAGMSRPTLYLYFRDKKDLFMATLQNLIEEVGDALETSLASSDTSPDGGFFDRVHEMYGDKFTMFFEIINTTGIDPDLVQEIGRLHETILDRMTTHIENRIPACKDRMDPYIVSNALLALFIGLQIRRKIGLPQDQVRESWNIVLHALIGDTYEKQPDLV
ncbi:MAG TPA: TetR/AcrR family transcriptional regulator [Methanospirillum sp.]|uniref:TetR/AcrR family transcriptional regulator n=1 Tax=Methanospirillum sp. TaxID=45200 RepID=UPI002C0DA992|nr:TetR/AcrR family transcriptional regulator [Methanospirillum sp.]HWQ63905.1 TetR/AcrR family transcriptional regulator [Methanospirillum sp.]